MNETPLKPSDKERKTYTRPQIVHEEAIVARASGCGKSAPGGNGGACDTQGLHS